MEDMHSDVAGGPVDDPTAAKIDEWFRDSFTGSVVSSDTLVWNHVFQSVEELKRRLSRG